MTNGNPGQAAAFPDSPTVSTQRQVAGSMADGVFEESLVKDVVPYIESHFRVKANKENRAITGLSMGGHQTINTTLKNPGMFDYIGVMSMGFADFSQWGVDIDEKERDQKKSSCKKKILLILMDI